MVLLHAVEGVLTLMLIGLVGYVLAARGWFSPDCKALLLRLVTSVSLPPYLFVTLTDSFQRDELLRLFSGIGVPFASILATFALSVATARLLHVDCRHRGVFCTGFTTSNTMLIGLPVNLALFGERAVPYVLLYFVANTIFFWTVGLYLIRSDARAGRQPFHLSSLRNIFFPPLLGTLTATAAIFAGFQTPEFLLRSARYVGSLTTPLSIIYIGIMLQAIDMRTLKLERDTLLVLCGRFVVSPLSVLAITALFPVPELMRNVLVIQSSLPVMMMVTLLAANYRSDPEFAAATISISTLCSLITIPLFMMLLS